MVCGVVGLDVEHNAVDHGQELRRVGFEVIAAVRVKEEAEAVLLREDREVVEERRVEGAFAAGDGDAADERDVSPHLGVHLFRVHVADTRARVMGAGMDAGVAADALRRIEEDEAFG